MKEAEKLEKLEEIMDLTPGTLKATDKLDDYAEWDSVSVLSFLSIMDTDFNKVLKSQDVKALITVADAMAIMEK